MNPNFSQSSGTYYSVCTRKHISPKLFVNNLQNIRRQHHCTNRVRRRTDEHGTGIEDMVQDFDDARDSDDEMEESAKAFYEMLESSKCPLHEHTELY